MESIEQQVKQYLSKIFFGNTGKNILEKEVVYSIELEKTTAKVALVLPENTPEISKEITYKIELSLKKIKEIEQVQISVFSSTQAAETALSPKPHPAPKGQQYLQNYKHVILVASGKGGVGKSTIAVNLSIALKLLGHQVSLMDADVFGPSIPTMLGVRGKSTDIIDQRIQPMQKFGIDFISLGNLVPEEDALIWRGPMVHSALEQLLRDTNWPGGDIMIIDLPPGTGDVQISLANMVKTSGAVVVCTPQDVALLDAKKAINMLDKVNIPVLGIIENMSSFICPHCGTETPIFSKGGAKEESQKRKLNFLGAIPIELEIRLGGDEGKPIAAVKSDSVIAQLFQKMAKELYMAL